MILQEHLGNDEKAVATQLHLGQSPREDISQFDSDQNGVVL